uniref:Ig-like domain-containing protein n=1 Tax=Astatotilapia calliptera TaxID=8154 RepID=A0AAX7ULM7_ASTCA
MAVWDKNRLWGLLFLLAGAVGQTVIYPLTSTCAVRGSTATLPCTFTPLKTFSDGGREVPPELIRVVWYQSQQHQLCQLNKPFVYDSDSKNHKQRFEYLGDKKTNCTLQIRDVQQRDHATFCFRMEVDHTKVHFNISRGVTVRVVDSTKMRIISSSDDKKLSRGETVTLLCASVCTFHQLEVTWFKDGHALSETGPSLELDFLTAEDSGNYTCALKANMETLSEPYSLQVTGETGAVGQTVNYPFTSTCAVTGSTATLPCTFTPPKSVDQRGREVPLKIVRVLWYQSHCYQLYQLTKPSVYDSDSTNNKPRYQYLGDMKTNCTLQIRDVQQRDNASFSFRMGVNHRGGHFTNGTGVTVRVTDGIQMRIISSSDDNKFRKKENVTLLCASVCTFHHLEVTWFKDGCILSETGSSLQLSSLTVEDSGNYTCALKTNMKTLSEPHSLQVEAGVKLDKVDNLTVARLLLFSAHTVLILFLASVILKGRVVCRSGEGQQQTAERLVAVQPPDVPEEPRTNEEERGQAV